LHQRFASRSDDAAAARATTDGSIE